MQEGGTKRWCTLQVSIFEPMWERYKHTKMLGMNAEISGNEW